MLVMCLSKCPPALRGDLTRWLQEIDTGVYAGNVSARVRDELWERVIANIKDGRATMVYSARNEQRMDFRVHNTEWTPIDFDGLKLIMRPRKERTPIKGCPQRETGFSKASAIHNARKYGSRSKESGNVLKCYVVIDVETTGLSPTSNRIIELGAIRVEDGSAVDQFERLIKIYSPIPEQISELTGITDKMISDNGVDEVTALRDFAAFIGDIPLVAHNVGFDLNFLRQGFKRCGISFLTNDVVDTVALAKRSIDDVTDFKLSTLTAYFGIDVACTHRSMSDCLVTKLLYEKLIEMR